VSDSQRDATRQALAAAQASFETARLQAASLGDQGAERRLAQAALDEARGALASAEARLLHTRITAPGDGLVLTRDVEPGDAVQPGRVLMEMTVAAEVQLTAEPDEKNLALLAPGQKAIASAEAFPEGRFDARVIFVSPSVDRSRGTVEVRLAVDQPPEYLRPEMTVSVDIEVGRRAGALAIPASGVRDPTTEKPWALVVRDGRIVRVELALGVRGTSWLEVRSGLVEGDLVVPRDARGVVIGQRVRPVVRAAAL
jgi:HlyD family secretion protein